MKLLNSFTPDKTLLPEIEQVQERQLLFLCPLSRGSEKRKFSEKITSASI